jgi:hypothetical protein
VENNESHIMIVAKLGAAEVGKNFHSVKKIFKNSFIMKKLIRKT